MSRRVNPARFHCPCRATSSHGTEFGGGLRFLAESIGIFQFQGW